MAPRRVHAVVLDAEQQARLKQVIGSGRSSAVLDVYARPLDERFPVVCMDEKPRGYWLRIRIPYGSGGRPVRYLAAA
ncbi:hypothetical protein GCM10022251_77470 [Phytohabitans flavus]|uniref:Uncharacterized protein n=1 Tax=Phytohabitans flavus TaxID=1076124 RepID=A0A6F8XIP1_9ACTN|nr:hypothetical protein Pflav_000710 [Phytohabitans flavus]